MASSFTTIIILITIICCKSRVTATEVRQDYAICKSCAALPKFISQLFDIFTKHTTARNVVHCAAKCQRTPACLSSVYCLAGEVGKCTLIMKRPPIVDLHVPLLGLSPQITPIDDDSADNEGSVLFPTILDSPQLCKCILFPAMLGLSWDTLNLLLRGIG